MYQSIDAVLQATFAKDVSFSASVHHSQTFSFVAICYQIYQLYDLYLLLNS